MLSSSFVITGQPHLQFIQDADALSAFCAAIQDVDCIAVDTEFVRERTYYPRLCLVQVASRDHLACIDTLAIDDLQPLLALMSDATITKVMHAARQDLEILLLAGEAVPGPVFDTQVAGDLCGLGNQLGLAAITAELIGVEVDKTHSRADWSRRPLNDTLLEYAANDVRHLIEIYDLLRQRLAELDRVDWQLEECERLAAVDLYRVEPDQAWKKVRGINRLPAPAYHVARELARWRESRAMDRDRPRNWVLRDDALLTIAAKMPSDTAALRGVAGLPDGVIRHCGAQILEAIAQGKACTEPAPEQPAPLNEQQKSQVKLLMNAVRQKAEELGISPSLLATRRDLTRVVRGRPGGPLMSGWRHTVIGAELPDLIEN